MAEHLGLPKSVGSFRNYEVKGAGKEADFDVPGAREWDHSARRGLGRDFFSRLVQYLGGSQGDIFTKSQGDVFGSSRK